MNSKAMSRSARKKFFVAVFPLSLGGGVLTIFLIAAIASFLIQDSLVMFALIVLAGLVSGGLVAWKVSKKAPSIFDRFAR